MATVEWKGDAILARLAKAARQSVDETTGRAVIDAKKNTPVVTATLQGSIRAKPAYVVRPVIYLPNGEKYGGTIRGTWGSFDVNYALPVETGTRGGAVNVRAHTRTRSGNTHRVRAHRRIVDPIKGRRMLRNARDREYPKLAARIAARYKRAA